MSIDNQKEYWNEVAEVKTFTHPVDITIIDQYLNRQSKILDFGCGYGRIIKELSDLGFENMVGYDTSKALIDRGRRKHNLPIYYIDDSLNLPVNDNSVDCILLFAVLTCIPSNKGQAELIKMLYSKLKTGGIIYISDYYLQDNSVEVGRYSYLNDDPNNFGVFSLPEGATFRHHTKEWLAELTKDFDVLMKKPIIVMTMNGHPASGFQLIGQK